MATQRLVLQCGSSTAAGLTQEKEAPRIRGNGSKQQQQHQQVKAPSGRFGFAVHEGLRMSSAPSSKGRRAMAARGTGSGRKGASLGIRCEKTVKLRLRLDHQVKFLGSADCTGAWQERLPMSWTESGWVAELQGQQRCRENAGKCDEPAERTSNEGGSAGCWFKIHHCKALGIGKSEHQLLLCFNP